MPERTLSTKFVDAAGKPVAGSRLLCQLVAPSGQPKVNYIAGGETVVPEVISERSGSDGTVSVRLTPNTEMRQASYYLLTIERSDGVIEGQVVITMPNNDASLDQLVEFAVLTPSQGGGSSDMRDGDSITIIFMRASSAPSTPTGGSVSNYELTPPSGWTLAVPTGSNQLYASVVRIVGSTPSYSTPIAFSGGGGGISGITVEDEGGALTNDATALNFTGTGVVASGTGATKTITIPGGSYIPIQSSAPTQIQGRAIMEGDLWVDNSGSTTILKVRTSSAWMAVDTHATIPDSTHIPVQDSAPASPSEGDLWIDTTGDTATLKVREGSAWRNVDTDTEGITVQSSGSSLSGLGTTLNFTGSGVSVAGTGSTKTVTITAGTGGGISGITIENDGAALAGDTTTLDFEGAGVSASGTGGEKTITVKGVPAQATAPTSASEGDLWVDTTGSTTVLKIYNGSAWVAVDTHRSSIDWGNVNNKPTFAPSGAEPNVQADWTQTDGTSDAYINNKPTSWHWSAVSGKPTFAKVIPVQNDAPTTPTPVEGDLWVDTSGSTTILKIRTGSAWVAVDTDTTISSIAWSAITGKPTFFTIPVQDATPTSPTEGDLWIDTTGSETVLKIYNGSAFVAVDTNVTSLAWTAITGKPTLFTIPVQDNTPASPSEGDLWVDTTGSSTTLKIYDGTNFVAVTGTSQSASWGALSGRPTTIDKFKGTWAAGVFAVGDVVLHSNRLYTCLVARAASDTGNPATDNGSWTVLGSAYRGTWEAGVYAVGDIVLHSTNFYICDAARTAANTGNPATDTSSWARIDGGGTSSSSLTVQEEGTALATAATTLDFRGDGIEATGTGATKTITVSGTIAAYKGTWAAGTYAVGDLVLHSSRIYVCVAARASSDTENPPTDNGSWAILGSTYRGTWEVGVYAVGDIVLHSSAFYICDTARTAANTSNPASDTTSWLQMTTGAPGIDISEEATILGRATTLQFLGTGVTAAGSGTTKTVTIPGPATDAQFTAGTSTSLSPTVKQVVDKVATADQFFNYWDGNNDPLGAGSVVGGAATKVGPSTRADMGWQGSTTAWAGATPYTVGTKVVYNEVAYRCIRAHTSTTTTGTINSPPNDSAQTGWVETGFFYTLSRGNSTTGTNAENQGLYWRNSQIDWNRFAVAIDVEHDQGSASNRNWATLAYLGANVANIPTGPNRSNASSNPGIIIWMGRKAGSQSEARWRFFLQITDQVNVATTTSTVNRIHPDQIEIGVGTGAAKANTTSIEAGFALPDSFESARVKLLVVRLGRKIYFFVNRVNYATITLTAAQAALNFTPGDVFGMGGDGGNTDGVDFKIHSLAVGNPAMLFALEDFTPASQPDAVYGILQRQITGDLVTYDANNLRLVTREFADQTEAEAGTSSTVVMTPQRTKQYVDSQVSGNILGSLDLTPHADDIWADYIATGTGFGFVTGNTDRRGEWNLYSTNGAPADANAYRGTTDLVSDTTAAIAIGRQAYNNNPAGLFSTATYDTLALADYASGTTIYAVDNAASNPSAGYLLITLTSNAAALGSGNAEYIWANCSITVVGTLSTSATVTWRLTKTLPSSVALEIPASALTGDIVTNQISDSAVTAVKVASNAITTAKLADNSVTAAKVPLATAAAVSRRFFVYYKANTSDANANVTKAEIIAGTGITKLSGYTSGSVTIPAASGGNYNAVAIAVAGPPITADNQSNVYSTRRDTSGRIWIDGELCWVYSPAADGSATVTSSHTISVTQPAEVAEQQFAADQLGTNAVQTAKINNNAVTTAKVANEAVTAAKMSDGARNATAQRVFVFQKIVAENTSTNQITMAEMTGFNSAVSPIETYIGETITFNAVPINMERHLNFAVEGDVATTWQENGVDVNIANDFTRFPKKVWLKGAWCHLYIMGDGESTGSGQFTFVVSEANGIDSGSENEAYASNTNATVAVTSVSTSLASVNLTPSSTSARVKIEVASSHEQGVNAPDLWIYAGTTRLGRGSFAIHHPNSTSQQTYSLRAEEAAEIFVNPTGTEVRRYTVGGYQTLPTATATGIDSVRAQGTYNPREDAVLFVKTNENYIRGYDPNGAAKSSADINLGAAPNSGSWIGCVYDGSADRVYAFATHSNNTTLQCRAFNPTTGAADSTKDIDLANFGNTILAFYDDVKGNMMLSTTTVQNLSNSLGPGVHAIAIRDGSRRSADDTNIQIPAAAVGNTINWVVYVDWMGKLIYRVGSFLEAHTWGDRPYRDMEARLVDRIGSSAFAISVPRGTVDGPSYIHARELDS